MIEALKMYQVIFDDNSYPMWMYDKETLQFTLVNEAAIKHYGYSRDEFLSMKLTDISQNKKIGISENNDDYQMHTFLHKKKNGDEITVEIGRTYLVVNNKNVIYNSINDITQLVKTQNALRESEESYRSLVENSEDMTMRFDREYRHLYANPVTEKFLGIKAEDFIGKNHEELGFSKDQYEYWDKKIEDIFVTGKATREVSEINAGEFVFHWDLIPEFDADGKVVSVLSVTRDMTDIAKSKRALEESEAKLKESNATKDKLFSIIAHDLRGPVGNLQQGLDLIINEKSLTEDETSYFLDQLYKTSKTANELLNNLLIWAKGQLGGMEIEAENFTINTVIQRNIDLFAANAEQKEIEIIDDVNEKITVFADIESINIVVRNLIANALKFTPSEGTIKITAKDIGNEIEIKVSDNGIGMSHEVIEKLFKPNTFFTLPGTNNERGSGLGLLLCKEFVESNKGTIHVTSILGKGSDFVFTLPKKQ